ncbi:MAG: cold shock CspA family protein [Parvicella sp.]|jgi:cold shock CspA family protein
MGRSQETFNKKEKEKKKLKKRQEKAMKKEERKTHKSDGNSLDEMIAYVDEFGRISDTPPDPTVKKVEIEAESIELGVPKREEVYEDPIKKGKIEYFNDQKGYGFIKEDGTGEKYFVHINGMVDELIEGNAVTFELQKGMKGMMAVDVKKG